MWRKRTTVDAGLPGAAARRWDAGARVIAELGVWENAVYLVEARPGVQVLRLVDAGRQPPEAVAAELDFVGHLVASGLPTARPIRSARGRLIEPVATADGRTFLASAFEYLAGKELSAAQCREAPAAFWRSWGAAVARLHTAAAGFTPVGPARPRWDDDPLVRRHAEILARAPARISEQFAETLDWLSALPVGFGLAALTAESLFPAAVPNRIRGCVGAAVSAAGLIMLIFVAGSTAGIAVLLGLTGLGLGLFVPANNAVIMRSGTASSAAVLGGLVSMARGIGTTFGIALVTLALHLGGTSDGSLAFAVLAAAVAGAALMAMTISPLSSGGPRAVSRQAREHSSVFS